MVNHEEVHGIFAEVERQLHANILHNIIRYSYLKDVYYLRKYP